jgi:uncharacterized protein (UPF0276 family)
MIGLGVNYYAELPLLAEDTEVAFQYVKVGDTGEEHVREALGRLPGKTILYHCGTLVRSERGEVDELTAALSAEQSRTASPWLSAHLDCYTKEEAHAYLQGGQPLPCYAEEESFDLICRAVEAVKPYLPVPLLLENMPQWPTADWDPATSPAFITRVLDETRCGLLLDLAHVRVSAANLGRDVHAYAEELPLERVVEIHVSGPRRMSEWWHDSHDTMVDEDYALLEWVLRRVTPKVVTLEYWKNPTHVRRQLLRLAELISPSGTQ